MADDNSLLAVDFSVDDDSGGMAALRNTIDSLDTAPFSANAAATVDRLSEKLLTEENIDETADTKPTDALVVDDELTGGNAVDDLFVSLNADAGNSDSAADDLRDTTFTPAAESATEEAAAERAVAEDLEPDRGKSEAVDDLPDCLIDKADDAAAMALKSVSSDSLYVEPLNVAIEAANPPPGEV